MLQITTKSQPMRNLRDDSELRVMSIVHVHGRADWAFFSHAHDNELEIILIINGKGKLHYNGCIYNTEKGDLLILNQGMIHREESDPEDAIEHICIELDGVKIDGCEVNCLQPDDAVPIIKTGNSFKVLFQMFEYAKYQAVEQKSNFAMVLQDIAKAIISTIIQIIPVSSDPSGSKEVGFPAILDIVEYLNNNYNQPISLELLAKHFHFSPFYIARKFKDETGFTINNYITDRRIGEAERLLIFSNSSIQEIAKKVGYENLPHFYTTFKKYTGGSPGEYKVWYNVDPDRYR